jgi:NhaA family Na+:H+ antiporter
VRREAWSAESGPAMRTRATQVTSSRLLEFLRTEEASGVFLLAAALIALAWANSPIRESYEGLWGAVATLRIGSLDVAMDLQHWVNEGLMTLFFLVVGLEIKREVVTGELRHPRKLALPAIAAMGGMVVPAGLYLLANAGSDTANGWGVPVATDIAFALGILTLAASHAPVSLRSFLLTLAIVDDVGAIVLIAVFYSDGLVAPWLLVAAAFVAAVILAQRLGFSSAGPYILLGIGLWVSLFASGVHPTLAGVALGLLAPTTPIHRSRLGDATFTRVQRFAERNAGEDGGSNGVVNDFATRSESPLDRVETVLHPWTTRFVAPTFALANAGVELSGSAVGEAVTGPVGLGVTIGLVVGKPLGIGAATWLAVRSGLTRLPSDVSFLMILGVAALAGVGFTVALFIAELAFGAARDIEAAKLAVLLASLLAGSFGAILLRTAGRATGKSGQEVGTRAASKESGRTRRRR